LRVRNTLAFKLYQDRLANVDPLTGFANRQTFMRTLQEGMQHAAAQETQIGLLHIDLEQFRQARETLGPMAADTLLKAVSRRLRGMVRKHSNDPAWLSEDASDERIARLGNQEFAVMLWPLESVESAATLAKNLLHELAQHFEVEGHQIFVAPVIGIALFPSDGIYAEALIKSA
jgi:diguanylate cyclase (GGDEF)-like protein